MNLQELISTGGGQCRVIWRKLDRINDEMSLLQLSSLIEYISEKAEITKVQNEKIINQCDYIETEIV